MGYIVTLRKHCGLGLKMDLRDKKLWLEKHGDLKCHPPSGHSDDPVSWVIWHPRYVSMTYFAEDRNSVQDAIGHVFDKVEKRLYKYCLNIAYGKI